MSRSSTFIYPITIFQLWFYFFPLKTPRFARSCMMSKNETNLCITRFLDWFGMLSVQIWQKSLCSNAPLQKPTFFDLCLVARPPSSQTQCINSYTSKSSFSRFFQSSFFLFHFQEKQMTPTKFYYSSQMSRWHFLETPLQKWVHLNFHSKSTSQLFS